LRPQEGMDFQSAMDTFVEAWMAANTKTDQVQVIFYFCFNLDKILYTKYYQSFMRLYKYFSVNKIGKICHKIVEKNVKKIY